MCLAIYTLHYANLPRRPLSAAEEIRAVRSGLKGTLEHQQFELPSEGQLAYVEDPLSTSLSTGANDSGSEPRTETKEPVRKTIAFRMMTKYNMR
jgi:hypothetical protein